MQTMRIDTTYLNKALGRQRDKTVESFFPEGVEGE